MKLPFSCFIILKKTKQNLAVMSPSDDKTYDLIVIVNNPESHIFYLLNDNRSVEVR